jgi:hypothetical protein
MNTLAKSVRQMKPVDSWTMFSWRSMCGEIRSFSKNRRRKWRTRRRVTGDLRIALTLRP